MRKSEMMSALRKAKMKADQGDAKGASEELGKAIGLGIREDMEAAQECGAPKLKKGLK